MYVFAVVLYRSYSLLVFHFVHMYTLLQARIQALHISKKFYTKPELAPKIEVYRSIMCMSAPVVIIMYSFALLYRGLLYTLYNTY